MDIPGKGTDMCKIPTCKVSICIPAYNDVHAIKRLLDSVFIQTYGDYEVIITDDSSTCDVQEYVISIGHPKVHYHKNEKRLGPTGNCNAAMEKASGEYIKMMHHDDWFSDAGSLGKYVEMLDNNKDADIAFSGSNQVYKDRTVCRGIADDKLALLRKSYTTLYIGNWIGAPSATIMRNKGQMFDLHLKWLVDVELYMRILKSNPVFEYTTEPYVSIGVGDMQLTNSCEHNLALQGYEYRYVLKKLRMYYYPDCLLLCLKICFLRIWEMIKGNGKQ